MIYFTRHAESQSNVGISCVDAPLTATGITQARQLSGNFDCVIVSPLRRTLETLHYSQITYNKLIISDLVRERIFASHDCKLLETCIPETDDAFFKRCQEFDTQLTLLRQEHQSILIVSHAYFFNAWHLKGCHPSPPYATILTLDKLSQ